jgi:DNA-binding XRE family transcriptional regulator
MTPEPSTIEAKEEHHNKRVARARVNNTKWREAISVSKREFRARPTRIGERRIKARISQGEIAAKVGLSPSTYGDIERGKRPVKKEIAIKIAEVLKAIPHGLFKKLTDKKWVAIR